LKERNARDEEFKREREREQRHHERQMEQERLARLPPVVEKKATGKFGAFLDETEEEERKEREEQEMRLKIEEAAAALVAKREAEFPTFGLKSAPVAKTVTVSNNWATMAQNASALPIPKPKVTAKAVEVSKPKTNYVGWAEDSEDEYEEEMYESAVASDDEPSSPRPFAFLPLTGAPCYARASYDDNDW
jgi:hypothetical protein